MYEGVSCKVVVYVNSETSLHMRSESDQKPIARLVGTNLLPVAHCGNEDVWCGGCGETS